MDTTDVSSDTSMEITMDIHRAALVGAATQAGEPLAPASSNVFLTSTSYRYPSAGSMCQRAGDNRSDVPSSRLMARERL